MTRFFSSSLFVVALLLTMSAARAQEMMPRQDDRVVVDLASEDWVTTKSAHVTVNVEAAVTAANSGTMRADMFKAVDDLAKADWRLTSFNRSQDQTGLERWSASFEARVPENQLGGLGEAVKKLSKAGMQLMIGNIDFSPTLDEMEAARATVRAQIYKLANDQLAAVNAAIPGRNYRIALINFTGGDEPMPPMPSIMRGRSAGMMMATAVPAMAPEPSAERAEKVTLTARVVFAAAPESRTAPALAPAPDVKH